MPNKKRNASTYLCINYFNFSYVIKTIYMQNLVNIKLYDRIVKKKAIYENLK